MADRFKPPSMDFTSPGDMYKRYKLFKQKCQLIFDGPMKDQEEEYKVRMLLLWVGDKGLEIYNTATFANAADKLKLNPVLQKFEAYTKPQSNQILARYQLRCLKQDDLTLEEFVTRARTLVDDSGYADAVKQETLRDTLVFGIKSDKVRQDAITKGDTLTFQQVYDLAKAEESTKAQMKIITGQPNPEEVHAIRARQKPKQKWPQKSKAKPTSQVTTKPHQVNEKPSGISFKGCMRCGSAHSKTAPCPAKDATCGYCGLEGHFYKVCLKRKKKRLHDIVNDPTYTGQDINLYDSESDNDDSDNAYPIQVGSITSQDHSLHSVESDEQNYSNRIYATVKINGTHKLKMKVDCGADTCVITKDDLHRLPFPCDIHKSDTTLHKYGGETLHTYGYIHLTLTFRGKNVSTIFHVVDEPGHPSIIGCRQSQALGIITVNVHSVSKQIATPSKRSDSSPLTKEYVLQEYKDCFDKIGRFPGEKYKIQLIDEAQPVIHAPRTVAVHLLPQYKAELDKMLEADIITPVTEPTEWVNSIVCALDIGKDGKLSVRLCMDPKDLNKNIKREHYYSRSIDEVLSQLHGKKYFSVVDTKKGYWHIELDHESSLLCTFNTPYGRYRFKRLPFGVIVSQDVFQRKLDAIFQDIPNVTGIADDILIYGSTVQEHDEAFIKVMEVCRQANVGLNSTKLQFRQSKVEFYGHTLTSSGIQPAEEKIDAIKNLRPPKNVNELQSILGMVTYLNRYSTRLAELSAPLRDLTKQKNAFKWDHSHTQALSKIKDELQSVKILSYYNPTPNVRTILQCDASLHGLGAWLRQVDGNGDEKIVAMSSRSLTDTESRYSNIERECLAVTYGLEKFQYYLLGRHTEVETDHSPLEQIFKKNINEAPARLQRLLLRCLRFDISVKYKQGKAIPVADALSRMCYTKTDDTLSSKDLRVDFISNISAPIDLQVIKSATNEDMTMNILRNTIYKGWPEYRKQCPSELWDYWNYRCDLVIENGLILKGHRIVIPEALRNDVKHAIHTGHQGETKCLLLAREYVFWPGISKEITQMVKDCGLCNKYLSAQAKLPILQPDLPTRPWEKLGTDIFEFQGSKYLMVVDYFSRFPIVRPLNNISADSVCAQLTNILAEYGLPSSIVADFGTQYTSAKFKEKCTNTGIVLLYSSPYHHQANSLAENAIGTLKQHWKKAQEEGESLETSLWMYRITPLDHNMPSPYELLYGRKPKTFIPSSKCSLMSQHPENDQHQEDNYQKQIKQAAPYNKKAGIDMRPLDRNEPVYVWNSLKQVWEPGRVFSRPDPIREPRTYIVDLEGRLFQRTRRHLRPRMNAKDDMPRGINPELLIPTTAAQPAITASLPPGPRGHSENQSRNPGHEDQSAHEEPSQTASPHAGRAIKQVPVTSPRVGRAIGQSQAPSPRVGRTIGQS